jgi:hypothetical protein
MRFLPIFEGSSRHGLTQHLGLRCQRLRILPYLQCRTIMAIPTCGSYATTSGHPRSKSTDEHARHKHCTNRHTSKNSYLDSQHPTRIADMQHHHPRNQRILQRSRTRASRQDRPCQRYSRTTRTDERTSIDRELHDALLRLRVRLHDSSSRRQYCRRWRETRLLPRPEQVV